ncbi:hypothetical protein [Actinomyces sp. S4-C9]|uniref:hypothetical protein n=1 Tax=Actinomyces sp. S4-C9 TaxID=1219581 RepID=UPI00050E0F4D|nr:hypothetical protein [Actinomyces sp. S4-C9]KGF01670.1 hypothetical protein HMPREF1628_05020 [Actinomyces sp. S4-C9]
MSYTLQDEVHQAFAGVLSRSELSLLLVIAGCAPHETDKKTDREVEGRTYRARECFITQEVMAAKYGGVKPESIGRVKRRLAKQGIDWRVPINPGKNGKPVYAFNGHACVYRIPPFEEMKRQAAGVAERRGITTSV